jgi:hypothetical protein
MLDEFQTFHLISGLQKLSSLLLFPCLRNSTSYMYPMFAGNRSLTCISVLAGTSFLTSLLVLTETSVLTFIPVLVGTSALICIPVLAVLHCLQELTFCTYSHDCRKTPALTFLPCRNSPSYMYPTFAGNCILACISVLAGTPLLTSFLLLGETHVLTYIPCLH